MNPSSLSNVSRVRSGNEKETGRGEGGDDKCREWVESSDGGSGIRPVRTSFLAGGNFDSDLGFFSILSLRILTFSRMVDVKAPDATSVLEDDGLCGKYEPVQEEVVVFSLKRKSVRKSGRVSIGKVVLGACGAFPRPKRWLLSVKESERGSIGEEMVSASVCWLLGVGESGWGSNGEGMW